MLHSTGDNAGQVEDGVNIYGNNHPGCSVLEDVKFLECYHNYMHQGNLKIF